MSRKNNNKRKRNYYKTASKKQKNGPAFTDNLRGILVSVDRRREKKATQELTILLNRFSKEFYPVEPKETTTEDKDISFADELKAELSELKSTEARRFYWLEPAQSYIFMACVDSTIPINPFVTKIFERIIETKEQCTRYCNRFLPIQTTFPASEILERIKLFIPKAYPNDIPISYDIDLKVTNNTGIKKQKQDIKDLIRETMSVNHLFRRDKPERILVIRVLMTVGFLGTVEKFEEFKKYNIRQIADDGTNKAITEKTPEQSESQENKPNQTAEGEKTETVENKEPEQEKEISEPKEVLPDQDDSSDDDDEGSSFRLI